MESLTFKERLQRWNNPTALEQFSVTAREATRQSEVACCPSHYEEKRLTVDRHALKELTFQMTVEGKQLGMQLDSLHQTLFEDTSKCEHQKVLSADIHKRTCGIGKEVRALWRRVEELQELLRKGKKSFNSVEHEQRLKDVDLGKPPDQSSLEELKAKLESLETEKQEMLEERKDWEREIQFLKCQLQYREEMKALQEQNGFAKLEEENALLRKENIDLRKKLDGLTDVARKQEFTPDNEELSMPLNSPNEASESRKSGLESELEILRKERKILLATVLKQQTAEKDFHKRTGTLDCDVGHNASVGSEGDDLRKKVEGLHAEMKDMEKDNKTLDDENNRLVEEKRALEDQVNKLKSQIADALESNFDEIEHLNQSIEDLQERFNLLQQQNKRLRDASNEFKERCATHFETALAEIEEKQSYADVVDYLTDAIDQLLAFDDEARALTANDEPQVSNEAAVGSKFLEEIKMCKELIEDQRQKIRQVQFDKRDLEESFSKMRRELMILKSEKRQEKRQDVMRLSQNESKDKEDRNDLTQQNEATQKEKGFLKSRQSELENLTKTLKEDNCKLENEKFCLLGSFYHLLERNEALEEQVAKQSYVVSTDKTVQLLQEKELSADERDLARPEQLQIQPNDSVESSMEEEDAKDESAYDLEREIQRIGDRLRDVQGFVSDTEGEKKKLKDELGERKKSKEGFRAVVMQLNQELTVLKGRVEKAQEMNGTFQDCLREVHDEKEELVASLAESSEEKVVLESSLADLEGKVKNLQREKDALQNDVGHCHEQIEKARQRLEVVCEKLSEFVTVLVREEVSSTRTETEEAEEGGGEQEIEALCKRSSLLLDKVVEGSERLRTASKRDKLDGEKLKMRVDALSIERQALQRYVRELDEKKKQMKVFISRLTEEKEALAEDIDEIKQQKMNLADALENVYRNKEEMQTKLEVATLKVEQLKASLRQGAEEAKTLRESLCRVVKERDAITVSLLTEKQQVERLRELEGKWRELAMGSHTEADQVIEVDRAIKEEMVNGRLKVEDSQTIAELKAERDELLKRVDSILTTTKTTMSEGDVTSGSGKEDETTQNGLEINDKSVEEILLDKERGCLHNDVDNEREEAPITAEHLRPLQNSAAVSDREKVPSLVDLEKWREENEPLAEMLRQSAEENEQLRNWLDAVVVEKGRLEQELDNTSEENKDLIRDLQRSSDEKEKLKLLLQKISGDKESTLDESNVLKDTNGQQKQHLDQEDAPDNQLEELHDCEVKSSDSLEQTGEELTEHRSDVATDFETGHQNIRDLTNQISIIQRENDMHVASLEKASESCTAMDKQCQGLMEDNQRLKDLNTESVQQVDALRLDNSKLSENNKRLTEDLKNSRKTLEKTLQKAQELRKEIRNLSENNQSLKKDIEMAKERESELKKRLKVVQQASDGMSVSITELNAEKEMTVAKWQQLADELEHLRATAEKQVTAEENLHTLKKEFEKSKSDLMAKEEKLSKIEEGLQNLLAASEEGTSYSASYSASYSPSQGDESRRNKEEILQDPLDQLKAVRQTVERRAAETKEFENCLTCVQQKVDELKSFTKGLEFWEVRSSLTDEVPTQSEKNKASCKLVGDAIGNALESVQKEFEEILTQKALATKKLEGAVVASKETSVKLAGELDKFREDLSMALKSNEVINSAFEELKRGQDKHQKLKQELQVAKNAIAELQAAKTNITDLLTEKEKHIAVVTSEKMQALEEMNNEVASLAVAKDDLERSLKEAQESVCNSKRQLEQSRKLTRGLQQEVEITSKQLRRRQNENEDLKLCVSKMDKEKGNKQKVLKDLERKNVALQKRAKETEDAVSKLAEENRELVAQIREQETYLKEVSEGKGNVEKKLKEQADCNYKSTLNKFEETRKALNKLQEEKKDLKACVASLDKDKRCLQKQLKDIKTKLEKEKENLVKRLNDEQLQIKNLEDLLKNVTEERESSHNSNNERKEENGRLNKRNQELDSRIKEMNSEARRVTDEKKCLENELTSEKSISADLRLRVDKANEDKDELEEILEQQRGNYKKVKEELEEAAFQKQAVEGKLDSAFAELEKAEDGLRGKTSCLEKRDAKLRQSEDEIKALQRELDENTKELCAVRKSLTERISDGEGKYGNADTEIKRKEGQEKNQLEPEVSSVIQKNTDFSTRLKEADTKITVLEKKLQQQEEEKDDNKKCIERSQQASSRLGVALESAKEEENRLRRQLEESNYRKQALESRLQETIEQMEHISLPCTSAVLQECAVERVLVTCADVPEPSLVSSESATYTEDRNNLPNFENAKKEVVLLESQVRKLRSELRMAKDQVFDLQQDLSDSKRALRQKELQHQQERTRFQEDIEEIEKECDEQRKRLSSLGEVEARRFSFSTVKDLKGTLRKAESDMWDVISKTARLLERAKDEMKEVKGREDEKPAIPRMHLDSNKSTGEKEDLRKKVQDLEKQKVQLQNKLSHAERLKELLKQTLIETLADVHEFRCLVSLGTGSSNGNPNEPTILRQEPGQEETEAQNDQEACSFQEAEQLCSQLEELRKVIKDLENRLGNDKPEGERTSIRGTKLKKEILETGATLENEKLQESGMHSRDDENRSKSTVTELTLHQTLEAVQILQTEKEALEAQCNALQGKVKEVAEGKNQLLEDALSFKMKYLKKNQELTCLLETKEHDVISLQTKNEDLTSLVQKMEDDLLKSGKEVETLRLQAQAARSEKDRVERINEEQKCELEGLRSRHNELNVTMGHFSSEINKLEDQNKALLKEQSRMTQDYGVEKAELLREREGIASRLNVREDDLREKEQKLVEDSASVQREKENLGNVTTKIQQMRDEYTRLESEYNVLLENISETKRENTALRKENSLVRKACDQLRARKTVAEAKIVEEVDEAEVDSVPPLEHKPERAIIRKNVIPLHRAASKEDDFSHISDHKPFKRHSISHSTTDHTAGFLIPISLSERKRDTFLDRRRASSLPTQREPKTAQGRTVTKSAAHNSPLSPLSSGDSSSRSSEVDSSVCSRRHYCSPILSVVDMCPLHHGSPLERQPSPCPVCRKKQERRNPKEFMTSEKYV